MKLSISMLKRFLEVPDTNLRHLFDELIGEVKEVEEKGNDTIYTIECLANRGDHLSVYGVAREVSARTLAKISIPTVSPSLPDRKASFPIKRNTEKCSKYSLLEMTVPAGMTVRSEIAQVIGVDSDKPAIVDLLNYVQLEFGQPMHAFDADKLEGEIIIDTLEKAEKIVALDNKEYTVPANSIVIRDKKKIVAVAGTIGCANSMVTKETKKVAVEAAIFDPVSVRLTARGMGIATEASHAFERGVDPDGIQLALKRLVSLASGSQGAVKAEDSAHAISYSVSEAGTTETRFITARFSTIREQLNLPRLDESEVVARLKNLGFGVEVSGTKDKELRIQVPSWRLYDVSNPEDITEEVVRAVGLDRVKLELPPLTERAPEASLPERVYQIFKAPLVGAGFLEVISSGFYSYRDAEVLTKLDPSISGTHIEMKNAVDQGNSQLKTSNIFHTAKILAAAKRHSVLSAKVFEFGRVFSTKRSAFEGSYEFERDVLTLGAFGRWYENEWKQDRSLEDKIFLFKGVLKNIVSSVGRSLETGKSDHPFFHPGIQATLKVGRTIIGTFGVIHPSITEMFDIKDDLLYAEIEPYELLKLEQVRTVKIPNEFPAIRRDITLKVDSGTEAGKVVKAIHDCKPEYLAAVAIIDDFTKREEQFRRVTFRLTFEDVAKTLEHPEVDRQVAAVLEGLKTQHRIEMA